MPKMGDSLDTGIALLSLAWHRPEPRRVPCPSCPLKDILDRAFEERYGVAAFNMVNDLTLEAVLAAAVELRAPRHRADVGQDRRSIGRDVLYAMWRR